MEPLAATSSFTLGPTASPTGEDDDDDFDDDDDDVADLSGGT